MFNWREKGELIKEVNKNSLALFQSSWKEDSCWKWLTYLQTQMESFESEKRGIDIETDFFYSMVHTIDFELLEKISDSLRRVIDTLVTSRTNQVNTVNVTADFKASLEDACIAFDLKAEEGLSVLTSKTTLLPEEKKDTFLKVLSQVGALYGEFCIPFSLTSALLLYYRPIQSFASLEDFTKLLQDSTTKKKNILEVWAPILRYLAQGFFSSDGDVKDEAVFYLVSTATDPVALKNKVYTLFYQVLLFVAFRGFGTLNEEYQSDLIRIHLWSALTIGVPVEKLLKEKLASEPVLDFYISCSGAFAEALSQSTQSLFASNQSQVTVSQFIQKFTSLNSQKDFESKVQKAYVASEMKLHGWPAESAEKLLRLISLFIHLRECTLVDYRGFLEDEGVIQPPYNFKELMQKDLSQLEQNNIREYFQLLHRAIKLKIELIVAFQSVDYSEEPFLSRMLTLNELYSDVYGEPYSPLVVFDEEKGDWKFRKELPPGPWKVVSSISEDTSPPEEIPSVDT